MRVGLKAMLVSPEFLFLREKPGKLDDFALASRLSYFLWSTMPDDELLALAEKKELGKPDVLREQVERMLNTRRRRRSPRTSSASGSACATSTSPSPSHLLYPEFDEMLNESMVRETELFFDELLKDDLSLTNFVASDFTMLNGRLAKHYGIPGVEGLAVPQGDAAAGEPPRRRADDGERAEGDRQRHDHLAGRPRGVGARPHPRHAAPPPPPDVPAVEPDIRGATTIREQLAKHRADADVCTPATPRSTRRASRWRAST